MFLFKNNKGKMNSVKEVKFSSEGELQELTEDNLAQIFGLELVKSEFEIKTPQRSFSIDTLTFDSENKAFVLIEYKILKSFSVIDQGYAYLAAALNNKSDLILEYNEHKNISLKKGDVDWSQTKVIFISPEFTPYQESAIQFKDLPIELWEARKFENDLLLYNPIRAYEAKVSINTISKSKVIKEVAKETKVFTVEDHLSKTTPKIKEIFQKYQDAILSLDDRITEKATSWYIGYRLRFCNFVSISLTQSNLRLMIRAKKIDDPRKMFRKIPKSYGWGKTPIWNIYVKSEEKFDYIMRVIKQAYSTAPDR